MKRFVVKGITIAILVVTLVLLSATFAFADNGPGITPDTGQPGSSAGNTCGPPPNNSPVTPGNAVTAIGSVFNPSGTAGTVYAGNQGTASMLNSNSAAAVSQYDIACFQLSQP